MTNDTARPEPPQVPDGPVRCAKCKGESLRSAVLAQRQPTCLCCGYLLDLEPTTKGPT